MAPRKVTKPDSSVSRSSQTRTSAGVSARDLAVLIDNAEYLKDSSAVTRNGDANSNTSRVGRPIRTARRSRGGQAPPERKSTGREAAPRNGVAEDVQRRGASRTDTASEAVNGGNTDPGDRSSRFTRIQTARRGSGWRPHIARSDRLAAAAAAGANGHGYEEHGYSDAVRS
ncbi:hypothetical protein BDW59DRAFT_163939 [Aspergillus cavernicola]|uniref:Uncharacterized protein n=1 Tax=Aspergillus cavernicola TaxID=176166 RepID=A0ABR4I3C0_9EURO